jgi:hypothetical protein
VPHSAVLMQLLSVAVAVVLLMLPQLVFPGVDLPALSLLLLPTLPAALLLPPATLLLLLLVAQRTPSQPVSP